VWFRTVGLSYTPDLVVLCYCPNDVDDPLDHFTRHTVAALPPFPKAAIPNAPRHARLLERRDAPDRPLVDGKQALKETALWMMRHSALAHLCARPFSYGRWSRRYGRCLVATADVASKESLWLRAQFDAIATTAKGADAPVLFLYLPLAYELGTHNPVHETSRRGVRDLAERCGFTWVDVAPRLAELDEPYLDVSHLSAAGHRVVADRLVEAIRQTGICPSTP
jgi:lysophospholipase L1-like esterase